MDVPINIENGVLKTDLFKTHRNASILKFLFFSTIIIISKVFLTARLSGLIRYVQTAFILTKVY